MSTQANTFASERLHIGAEPDALARIGKPGVELAVWRRAAHAAWSPWLDALAPAQLPRLRTTLSVVEIVRALHAACHAAGTPPGAARDAWVADTAAQAYHFARISRSARLRVRLDVVDDNGCRRLHRDCVPLRLLCTCRGPGTVWVKPNHAAQALAAADDYDGPLEHLAAHDVAIFKGCGFPGQQHDSGIVHRSPRIEGSGITRLVLCLDPLPEPSA